MGHWLLKTEPSTYSWSDLVKEGSTCWSGVRNFQARNNLRLMRIGDRILIYHSVHGKEVVGVAQVIRESYPDPTAGREDWVAVDIKPLKALRQAVSLAFLKQQPALAQMALLHWGRLSVCPVKKEEFTIIIKMAEGQEM